MGKSAASSEITVRIDKWLWAARFFKTRALASTAVNGGKIHLNGQRIKPSRAVKVNDIYEIQRGFDRITVVVEALSDRRGSATVAQALYRETEESQTRRAHESEQRRLARLSRPVIDHRPNKRERRSIRSIAGKD